MSKLSILAFILLAGGIFTGSSWCVFAGAIVLGIDIALDILVANEIAKSRAELKDQIEEARRMTSETIRKSQEALGWKEPTEGE